MTFPALDALSQDPTLRHTTWRVYMALQREWLSHAEPRPVKEWAFAERHDIRRASVRDAIRWLIARGYLIDHGRDGRVRRLSLAWALAAKRPIADAA